MNNRAFDIMLESHNFKAVGNILLENESLRFTLDLPKKEDARCVYLWAEFTKYNEQCRAVYVGMAGKTLKSRCDQHQNGFIRSTTGTSHATRLSIGIDNGMEYKIYARKSHDVEIFGEKNIPMVTIEEIAFIQKFCPPWNRRQIVRS